MFRPSVKIKPKKPNLYFNKSVTIFDDNEVGNFGFGSNTWNTKMCCHYTSHPCVQKLFYKGTTLLNLDVVY